MMIQIGLPVGLATINESRVYDDNSKRNQIGWRDGKI